MKQILFFWIVTLLLMGCATATPAPTSEPPVQRLVIYSGRSERIVQLLIDDFSADTGIEVEVHYGNSAELAAQLLEEGANSRADLFFTQDPSTLGTVANAGLFASLTSDVLGKVSSRYTEPNEKWVGITSHAHVVVYNDQAITLPAEQLPLDLMGFTDPAWAGKIGWSPSSDSFQAMVTAMRVMWGEAQTRDWLQAIQANDPIAYADNTALVTAVGAGEVTVGFANHPELYRFLAGNPEYPAKNYFLPSGGPGSVMMVSGAGILDSAENHLNATRFLNHLLSEKIQRYFTTAIYEYPVVAGIESNSGLAPFSALDTLAPNIPLNDFADLQGTQNLLTELGIVE